MGGSEFQPPGGRSAAEREAARKERERRRAKRRGEQVDETAQTPAAQAQEHATPPADEQRAGEATQAWDLSDQPAVIEQPADRAARVPAPGPAAPVAAPGQAVPATAPGQAAPVAEPGQAAPVAAPVAVASAEPEQAQPAGSRPAWRPRGAAQGLPAPPPPVSERGARALRPRVSRASGGGGGAARLRARAGALGALVIVAIAVWGVVMLIQHLGDSKGTAAPRAARAPGVKIVIPEGEDRRQIAAIARKDGLTGDYKRASVSNQALHPMRFGAPADIPNLEGFLFPATYEMPVHGNVKGLVERQLEAFQERFGAEEQKHARALGVSSYQLLIVASMIEREAYLARDRPLVAAVIYNRLRLGMPLGIDSTLRFALNDFTKPLTEAQLQTPSPYNTRLHKGLPPTPISNPGMEAIEAAAHPAHAGYLYYVDGADGCGDLVFSNTEAEFEANKAAYDQALAANGGHTPACKRK